jgi:hypothetical protein
MMAKSSDVPDEVRQFNAFLAREKEEERRQRAVRKAETAKQRAAERVRVVNEDPKASRDDKVAAEQAYREAVEACNVLRQGDEVEVEPQVEPEQAVAAEDVAAPEPGPDDDEPDAA